MRFFDFMAPFHFRVIWANLAKVLQLLGLLLLLPALVGVLSREPLSAAILGGLALTVWGVGRLGGFWWQDVGDLELREALVVSALSYLLFAVVGACVYLPHASSVDALFESMSGFTTTGLSVLDAAQLPKALLFFRAYSQWLGGIGIVILSLVVLLGPGKTAHQLYALEFGKENLLGSVVATARVVVRVYLLLTGAGFFVFVVMGMPPFEALLHILTTVSTGGFAVYPDSIGHYGANGRAIAVAVMLFMFLGAVSLTLYYFVKTKGVPRFFRDLQVIWLLGLVAGGAALIWWETATRPGNFFHALFHAVSSVTTTGFSLSSPADWGSGPKFLSICLMIIGGSAGSTAGGIKILRLIVMVKLVIWYFKKLLLPEETTVVIKYGALTVPDAELKQMVGFLFLYLALLCLSTLAFTSGGFPVADALFESASALGTVGLSSGITSPDLSVWLKWLLIFDMWAGRLEILPVLVMLYPGIWLGQRRTS